MGEINPINRGNGSGARKRKAPNTKRLGTQEHQTEKERMMKESAHASHMRSHVDETSARGLKSGMAWQRVADAKADSAKSVRKAHK